MSRSVSAPSSVTKTSPCWKGLIVPGSTLRYGSNFWSWTRSPRALSNRPSEAATIPFPSAETTPPVTKTYFGARALTGFQGSTRGGGRLLGARADERGELRERLRRERATQAAEARALDSEPRGSLALLLRALEVELDVDVLAAELEGDAPQGHDLEHEQRPSHLRAAEEVGSVRALELPERTGSERSPHCRLSAHEARPPFGPPRRLGEHRPHVLDGCRQDAPSLVPRQEIPVRRASARAPPSARPLRAARSAYGSGRPASSRPGSDARRARRSVAGA